MKKVLAAAVLLGAVFAASFAVAAWASTQIHYVSGGVEFQPGQGGHSGYTGLGWTDNQVTWHDPDGGTPNMCLNYINTSGAKLLTDKCSGAGTLDDTRTESNYSAAKCFASSANNYPVITTGGCYATHN